MDYNKACFQMSLGIGKEKKKKKKKKKTTHGSCSVCNRSLFQKPVTGKQTFRDISSIFVPG
jgi:hypothetical protein